MSQFEKTEVVNADQIAFWNSAHGEKWVTLQEGLDAIHAAALERLIDLALPGSGERLLDVGCGAGSSTIALASFVGQEGDAVGLDVSRPLLDRAEELRLNARLDNVRFVLADAQTHQFEHDRYDLLVSRFGMMFFSDPIVAFRNLATALRPGARVAFVCWAGLERNPWFAIPRNHAIVRLGPPLPVSPRAPGPFSFSDVDYVMGILNKTDFIECQAITDGITMQFSGTAIDAASIASNIGAATRIAQQYGASQEIIGAIEQDVAMEFEGFDDNGTLRIPAVVNLFSAVKA